MILEACAAAADAGRDSFITWPVKFDLLTELPGRLERT
jgi:hypothetical protein